MLLVIFGLPGSGKTSLAKEVCRRTDAIHINADQVRLELSSDLGFSLEDRIEQSRRLGSLARLISSQGKNVVVDFVNPTRSTREVFGGFDYSVFLDRISTSRFEDTNSIWEHPSGCDLTIKSGLSVAEETELVIEKTSMHDWTKPTTLMLGRYQPWHEGHDALYEKGLEKTNQILIGVRNTEGTSPKDPLGFEDIKKYIGEYRQNPLILKMPNITNVIYGRDVGYTIEKVELSPELQAISATNKRREMGI